MASGKYRCRTSSAASTPQPPPMSFFQRGNLPKSARQYFQTPMRSVPQASEKRSHSSMPPSGTALHTVLSSTSMSAAARKAKISTKPYTRRTRRSTRSLRLRSRKYAARPSAASGSISIGSDRRRPSEERAFAKPYTIARYASTESAVPASSSGYRRSASGSFFASSGSSASAAPTPSTAHSLRTAIAAQRPAMQTTPNRIPRRTRLSVRSAAAQTGQTSVRNAPAKLMLPSVDIYRPRSNAPSCEQKPSTSYPRWLHTVSAPLRKRPRPSGRRTSC